MERGSRGILVFRRGLGGGKSGAGGDHVVRGKRSVFQGFFIRGYWVVLPYCTSALCV